jgi:hypothetical protein
VTAATIFSNFKSSFAMVAVLTSLASLLDNAQRSTASHKKNILLMQTLYRGNEEPFVHELICHINRVLPIFKSDAAVDRLIQLFVNFSISLGENDSVMLAIFQVRFFLYMISFDSIFSSTSFASQMRTIKGCA